MIVKRPTLTDLAAAAGVSKTSASNAFNRPERLSPARRRAILEAAERIGYAGPDPTAAGLRRGRVGSIGVILSDRLDYAFKDPAAVAVLDGMASVLASVNASLLLLAGDGTGHGPIPSRVAAAAVDGFVSYCLSSEDPLLDTLRRRRLPTVFMDAPPWRGVSTVDIDEEGGSQALVEHLLALGHHRFGIVTLPGRSDGYAGPMSEQRLAGITFAEVRRRLGPALAALAGAGIPTSSVALYEPAHNAIDAGEQAGHWLLTQSPAPTAVVCQSDQLAIGVLKAATTLGLRVPIDVSIGGFDDVDEAARTDPPLTTVRQPLRERGRLAGELVLKALDGGRATHRKLATELVVRRSTGPAPRRK